MFDFKPTHRVVSKIGYHMYALGEEVMRISAGFNAFLNGYEYVNNRGIRQHLREDQVEPLAPIDSQ